MFIEQLHQEPFLLFFLLVLVLPLLYEVLGLGDEEDGGGHVDGQLPPHLPRAPIHCCLVDAIFSLMINGSFFSENLLSRVSIWTVSEKTGLWVRSDK